MRIRHALFAAPLLLLSFVALAQPKRAAKEPDAASSKADKSDKPDKSDKADRADKADSRPDSTPGAANGSSDDLGGPPPKPAGGSESKLSPLNPEANEFPDGGSQTPPVEYDKLLGDIAALRSRVSAVTTTLYASKVRVVVETRGSDARVASFTVTLDDGVVFSAPDRFVAEDERTVYEHAVAPGHHVVGIEIERFDTRGADYRTWQSSRFSVVIPESKLVDAHVIIQDNSDMAKDFPSDQDGQYDLRVRLRARVEK